MCFDMWGTSGFNVRAGTVYSHRDKLVYGIRDLHNRYVWKGGSYFVLWGSTRINVRACTVYYLNRSEWDDKQTTTKSSHHHHRRLYGNKQ